MSSKTNPTLKYPKIKVGITIGDPSGIGRFITMKAINRLKGLADFTLIPDPAGISRTKYEAGKVSPESGRASIEYLDEAIRLIKSRDIDCLVTCPVSKEAINLAGIDFSGHTEYLARAFRIKDYVMMLLNGRLKFSLITRHIPLKNVSRELESSNIYGTIAMTEESLRKLFLIKRPRIVVCGINPHASDNGVIGKEEIGILKPCIDKIKKNLKFDIVGPLSSDIAISEASKGRYDCVIAIYHDQALIPLKLTGMGTGVNLTLGLPFVRTSPLHGTAFDIAKKPALADPGSLMEAIKLAVKCTLNLKKD